ncbi:MAG: PQQ-dependent sugar dehydrogenase, partial [Polyangiaceae bacterium]|nr:PQQ-dependent sugar dehydrogenase [Polyangiaceae bacterium]
LGRTPGDPDSADPASERRLLVLPDDESNHNGGMLAFGPDGMLYIGLGDGGGGGDQHGAFGNGQNLASLWGKIARLDVDAAAQPYGIPAGNMTTIPAGNPSTGPVAPEIWSYGLRNPWRFAFDPCTDDLYIGDVGQGSWEEVDFAPAGAEQGRRNYGWRSMEGTHCYDANLGCEAVAGYTPPVLDYPHGAECSVTGGYVYRASGIPALRGSYLFGDYCSGAIWRTTVAGGVATPMEPLGVTSGSSLVSFGQDNLGNVYAVYLDGRVLRLDPQ